MERTFAVGCARQSMHAVCHRHRPGVGHPRVQSFLFHLAQLRFEVFLVDRLADRGGGDGLRDLLAQRVLLAEFVPVGGTGGQEGYKWWEGG
jgi:hypothetical protein